jgi:phosphoglycerate kinase
MKTIKDLNLKAKKVFIRVDFNVPLKNGVVGDDTRIREALPTIRYVLEQGGIPVLASHLGRPKGEKNPEYSLKPVADYINSKGYLKVAFVEDCIGDKVAAALAGIGAGEVLLLENLRFYSGEEKNTPDFVQALAAAGYDAYVNDAFGTSHRKHASVYGLPLTMPERAAGFLVEKEVNYFGKIVSSPDKPCAAVIGGAKVSDKIGVIESLLDKADKILIGGAMAYTFLKYQGHGVGKSLVEDDQMDIVKAALEKSAAKNVPILLPFDHLISAEFGGAAQVCDAVDIPEGFMGLDIGPKTAELYQKELSTCKTVLWNGPMGVFEQAAYAKGTFAIAECIAAMRATTVVGGGDSVAAVNKSGVADKISHISTGGGASLEYLEYGTLPGVEVLM